MLPSDQTKKPKANFFTSKYQHRLYEGVFILVAAFSVFLLLALFTYHAKDPSWSHITSHKKVINLGGYAGAWLADIFFCGFGLVAYLFPFLLSYFTWLPCQIKKSVATRKPLEKSVLLLRGAGFIFILLAASSLAKLNLHHTRLPFGAGGITGSLFSSGLLHFFSLVGANLLLLALLLSSITLFSGISWLAIAEQLGRFIGRLSDLLGRQMLKIPWLKLLKNLLTLRFIRKQVPEDMKIKVSRFEPELDLTELAALEAKPSRDAKAPIITPPQTIKTSLRAEQEKQITLFEPDLEGSLPPLSLLDLPKPVTENVYSNEQLAAMSTEVELRLADFGIEAKVVAVHPGPVVTRFELELAAGTKVSKITILAKDLARSLSVVSVRIVEVIPGKSVIGLELPNEHREVVRLREILSSQSYEMARAPLTIALGKDISGHPVIVDLAKMPHLLVAGTTGSGKSVCLNAILLSLLYKYTAKDVRLLLIDPKMLELAVYEGIPHLLTPVVTDMKEAANALRWCVFEMERRYKLLAALGVRNISGYNHKIKEARNKGTPILDPLWQAADTGEEETPQELAELPYIVVIADEYADMIMVVGKKVEELIARIAQKARAAGIHLILATQRPSVDVITGLIKANISTRIALQVSSKIDSRTILDQGGAEQLLGFGDMLYLPPGSGVPIRVHGAFVADDEVHRVTKDLKRRAEPEYIDIFQEKINGNGDNGGMNGSIGSGNASFSIADFGDTEQDAEQDPLYDQAVQIVIETRRASISQIQRRLRIGYNRAARMVDAMEQAGIVSAMEANGNREVLVPTAGKEEG